MSQRTERVDELLRQEIGTILSRDVKDPRIGFATITDVETTPDLRHARVWVSVIGQQADRDETIRALGQAMHFVRRELGQRLRLKRIPELHVRLDDSAERGTRVLHLLQELEEGREVEALESLEPLPTPVPRLPHEGDAHDGPGESASADVPIDKPARAAGGRPARRRTSPSGPSRAPGGRRPPRRSGGA